MKTVGEWLKEHGKQYPAAGADGTISMEAFEEAGVPMVVSCACCAMTMLCRAGLACDDNGRIYCDECAGL